MENHKQPKQTIATLDCHLHFKLCASTDSSQSGKTHNMRRGFQIMRPIGPSIGGVKNPYNSALKRRATQFKNGSNRCVFKGDVQMAQEP